MKRYAVIPNNSIYMRTIPNKWVLSMIWEKELRGWVPSYHEGTTVYSSGLKKISQIKKTKIIYYEEVSEMIRERFDEFL